jgi:hypothetical protein
MFGRTMDEGAAILGEVNVHNDGSWLAEIPPYVPVHLQPIDKFGMSVRNQRLWIQGMPGESRVCGGCHESRTGYNLPGAGQNPTAASTIGPQNFFASVQDRMAIPATITTGNATVGEYPWDKRIQPLLDAKCASCHNGTTNGNKPQEYYTFSHTAAGATMPMMYPIPRLDLSSTEVTAYYDRKVQKWPASYVSIFFPATISMSMGMGGSVQGNVPPSWGVPEAARESVLIEKLNVQAADGSYAWDIATHPMHPEDVNVTLTPDERALLIRSMDLGGQFYSRANADSYVPAGNDAVGKQ